MGVFALRLSSVTPVGVISMLYIQSVAGTTDWIYNVENTPTGVTEDNFLYLKFV